MKKKSKGRNNWQKIWKKICKTRYKKEKKVKKLADQDQKNSRLEASVQEEIKKKRCHGRKAFPNKKAGRP